MLRDARADRTREFLAERYIRDMLPIFDMYCRRVTGGDYSLIDRYQDLLAEA